MAKAKKTAKRAVKKTVSRSVAVASAKVTPAREACQKLLDDLRAQHAASPHWSVEMKELAAKTEHTLEFAIRTMVCPPNESFPL